jgi:hypothetical protein
MVFPLFPGSSGQMTSADGYLPLCAQAILHKACSINKQSISHATRQFYGIRKPSGRRSPQSIDGFVNVICPVVLPVRFGGPDAKTNMAGAECIIMAVGVMGTVTLIQELRGQSP